MKAKTTAPPTQQLSPLKWTIGDHGPCWVDPRTKREYRPDGWPLEFTLEQLRVATTSGPGPTGENRDWETLRTITRGTARPGSFDYVSVVEEPARRIRQLDLVIREEKPAKTDEDRIKPVPGAEGYLDSIEHVLKVGAPTAWLVYVSAVDDDYPRRPERWWLDVALPSNVYQALAADVGRGQGATGTLDVRWGNLYTDEPWYGGRHGGWHVLRDHSAIGVVSSVTWEDGRAAVADNAPDRELRAATTRLLAGSYNELVILRWLAVLIALLLLVLLVKHW
jgi:hypothetical protein